MSQEQQVGPLLQWWASFPSIIFMGITCFILQDYISNISAGLTADIELTDLPKDQLYSLCAIAILQKSQRTSFSNHDASVASQWSAVQSTCNINSPTDAQLLVINVTDSPGYATSSYTDFSQCLSSKQYSVKPGDDCQQIATLQSASTGTLIATNNLLPDCSNLLGGAVSLKSVLFTLLNSTTIATQSLRLKGFPTLSSYPIIPM